ncbi:hypothetical protein os1_36970 [Comamonadaceae bacterium OS-1]|nr:hypothetical protein os1_36970 [Comamonadaceae bacterium OS-1]
MTGVWRIVRAAIGAGLLAWLALWAWWQWGAPQATALTHLALLVPDDVASDDPVVQAWQDAAAETGFPLAVVRASALLRPGGYPLDAALVVPDTVHRRMNSTLVAHLEARVRAGAQLMLVHDAGVSDMDGNYHPVQSRLSTLAGVGYGLYEKLGPDMLSEQVAWVDGAAVPLLRLPPGKLMREGSESPLVSTQPAPQADEELAVVSYNYGRLRYPVFATSGAFDGQRLMHFEGGGLLAGVHTLGQGKVLFVNLPLGYLKLRTDGFFLHSFLRYFAQDMAQLPQLSALPEAQGALIMNWHIDSAKAEPAMEKLQALGIFEQGPYSVDLTAGPDVDTEGDGDGMDLDNNPRMQAWVRRFAERGDEVGSHGGWIHNAFGQQVDKQPQAVSIPLIQKNVASVQAASGKPVREYSAPVGNHPAWVTQWLHNQGIRAYYSTGDIGMAPTRSYQGEQRGPGDMWAFPVLSYGTYGTFEDAQAAQQSERDIAAWLKDVADYCAQYRTVRLVYFHPPGIAMFPLAFKEWMQHTASLLRSKTLRWITMAQYADFANQRLQVQWAITPDAQDSGTQTPGAQQLRASHPQSLAHMAWLLPMQRYAQPVVLEGTAQIDNDGSYWRVVAGDSATLRLQSPTNIAPANMAPAQTAPAQTVPASQPLSAPLKQP